jgi:multidrug transporter EmrE-like cation transporter
MSFVPYLYALYLAGVDGIMMPLLKAKKLGMLTGNWMFPLTSLIYAMQPLVFYQALSLESMTIMNILWDVMSDIIVTVIGIFVFGESLTKMQMLGLVFSLIGITLLGCKDGFAK